MSSPEEDFDNEHSAQNSKKRRVQRACDICRRKKVRCDGGQMPGNKCSNCVTYNHECTYIEAAKKRGPPKGYVESLENRLQKMEGLLNKLCPDADFAAELGVTLDKETWYSDRGEKPTTSPIPPAAPNPDAEDLVPSDDEIIAQRDLIRNMKQMEINNNSHMRFFGKSSSVMFIQTAIEAKHEYSGQVTAKKREQGWRPILPLKRPQFWGVHPWILGALHQEKPQLVFPEQDLLTDLIELFFSRVNDYQPLLHRPTFQDCIEEGMHHSDEGFGSIVLLVCAVASRFSDDPRVFLEGSDSTHSSGWEWFRQVQLVRKSLLAPPRLYDLQICALTAIFLQSTSAPQACWTVIGVGIRLAQDVGAHRRKVYTLSSTVDQELWKRAFWVLVSMDRAMSMTLGRPCAIQDEDFDVELPVECDDEYWELSDSVGLKPERVVKLVDFKHPAGKPSKITYFNCFLRLNQILAFALRTIYSINKSKALLGFVGTQWEQHIVAELDSALNKWIDSVPDHLRWDPNRENLLFLVQSASLYAHYYQLQIAVHRPFIPSPKKPSPLSFPSLAICTNAARSCTHVLDVPFRRANTVLHASMEYQVALFTSGIVLLLNIWGGKRSGLSTDPSKEMDDVHKCMKMLKMLEPRWHTAGRLWDVLYELAQMGDLPLPQASPSPSNKRDRSSSDSTDDPNDLNSPPMPPTPASMPTSPPSMAPSPSDRQFAGSRRVSQQQQLQQLQQQQQQQMHQTSPLHTTYQSNTYSQPPSVPPVPRTSSQIPFGAPSPYNTAMPYSLPMYTADLGRMPLHPGSAPDQNMDMSWRDMSSFSGGGVPLSTPASGYAASSSASGSASSAQAADPMPKMPSMFSNAHVQQQGTYEQVMSTMTGPPALGSNLDGYANVIMDPQMDGSPDALGTGGSNNLFSENDTLAMWSNAPQGFEWDDWGTFITHGLGPQPGGSGQAS